MTARSARVLCTELAAIDGAEDLRAALERALATGDLERVRELAAQAAALVPEERAVPARPALEEPARVRPVKPKRGDWHWRPKA